jgi:hypothetical protein
MNGLLYALQGYKLIFFITVRRLSALVGGVTIEVISELKPFR